jgi:hypothetical protein
VAPIEVGRASVEDCHHEHAAVDSASRVHSSKDQGDRMTTRVVIDGFGRIRLAGARNVIFSAAALGLDAAALSS